MYDGDSQIKICISHRYYIEIKAYIMCAPFYTSERVPIIANIGSNVYCDIQYK